MIYTTDGIREKVTPVAEKYGLRAVYLFGSYARGEAGEDSDVDLLIDTDGSRVDTMFDLGGVYSDLEETLGKAIDLVTTGSLEQDDARRYGWIFINEMNKEKLRIYHADPAARKEGTAGDAGFSNHPASEGAL